MKHLHRALSVVAAFSMMVTFAEAQQGPPPPQQGTPLSQGGANQYPENDNQARGIRTNLPPLIAVNSRSLRGTTIARGRKVNDVCNYDFGVRIRLFGGRRDVVLRPNETTCEMILDHVQDTNVIEQASIPSSPRGLLGRLMQTLFPKLEAQSPTLRTLYSHIYTCGVACAGGADGLTAQQGWLNFRFVYSYNAQMDSAVGWFCTSGSDNGTTSRCMPGSPLGTWGSPMNPVNTGWWGYNFYNTGKVWGPGESVMSSWQTSFFWAPWPATYPRYFEHTLYMRQTATRYGDGYCDLYTSGSFVMGPILSCQMWAR